MNEDFGGDSIHQLFQPVLYTNVPVISERLLKSKFDKLLPISSITLKTSNNSIFNYFSHKQLWSGLYDKSMMHYHDYTTMKIKDYLRYFKGDDYYDRSSRYSYFNNLRYESSSYDIDDIHNDLIQDECKNNLTSCYEDITDTFPKYIYSTHPHVEPYLSGIAPGLAQFITLGNDDDNYPRSSSSSSDPKVNLWLSSANVTTALHYDYEDNYLLQIGGKKHITLISPEAIDILSSYPTYHPLWRQSIVYEQIFTVDQFISYIHSNYSPSTSKKRTLLHDDNDMDNDGNQKKHHNHSKTKKKTKKQIKSMMKQKVISSQHDNNKIDHTIYGKIKVWDFDLNPGQMVFIPAGYYHLITTISDSISINAWYTSRVTENYEKLLMLSLPFQISDTNITIDMKVTQLIFIVKQVYHQLGLGFESFKYTFQLRYKHLRVTTDDHVREGGFGYYGPLYRREDLCSLDAKRILNDGI